MNELERLHAAIAEQKRRWTEKYGWVSPEECRYPTMEEQMRREVETRWTREANDCIRRLAASARCNADHVCE